MLLIAVSVHLLPPSTDNAPHFSDEIEELMYDALVLAPRTFRGADVARQAQHPGHVHHVAGVAGGNVLVGEGAVRAVDGGVLDDDVGGGVGDDRGAHHAFVSDGGAVHDEGGALARAGDGGAVADEVAAAVAVEGDPRPGEGVAAALGDVHTVEGLAVRQQPDVACRGVGDGAAEDGRGDGHGLVDAVGVHVQGLAERKGEIAERDLVGLRDGEHDRAAVGAGREGGGRSAVAVGEFAQCAAGLHAVHGQREAVSVRDGDDTALCDGQNACRDGLGQLQGLAGGHGDPLAGLRGPVRRRVCGGRCGQGRSHGRGDRDEEGARAGPVGDLLVQHGAA
ncbi:hypothetical protein ACFWD7_42760 [Streptomyces mirabilis]|uniref:hypothetical protein n=1 Tax=Streptomyces mirabilis TaxID=68239 RepID=UPI0036C1EE7F